MGLAASQGRLLLLTARKSDLEFRAQSISQRRLMLAQELETVSATFARKSGNRQMKIAYKTLQGETNTNISQNLTYDNLMTMGAIGREDGMSMYRIKNAFGDIVTPNSDIIDELDEAGVGYRVTKGSKQNPLEIEITSVSGVDEKIKNYYNKGDTYVIDKGLNDTSNEANLFQEGLRNGKYIIQSFKPANTEENAENEWENTSWSGMNQISDGYYTDDDAEAQAAYDAASARVQAQDKKLENDQKQIETQHKAVETEIESVNKVIQSNIEGSFKMFS